MQDWITWSITMIENLWKHGATTTAIVMGILAFLKMKSVQKSLLRLLPFYHEKKSRLEQKVDLLLEREGITWNGPEEIRKVTVTNSKKQLKSYWGVMKMKEYLKKLGSRKFQALIGSLAVNGLSFYLFVTGVVDIDPEVNKWMPVINIAAGSISNLIYIWVEGGVDKSKVETGKGPANDTMDFTQDTAQ